MWSRRGEEEPNGGGREILKTEGAAVGVMLCQIGSGRSKPGLITSHLHMKGALCHSKHYICICNAAQTQGWEFVHRYVCVCVCVFKQVLRGQIVINLNSTSPVSTWHTTISTNTNVIPE